MLKEMKERLETSRQERQRLKENIVDQTVQRIKFVLGENATEENVNRCSEPYLSLQDNCCVHFILMSLIDRYSDLVDESRVEIDSLNQILESKNREIATLSKENEKYIQLTGVG